MLLPSLESLQEEGWVVPIYKPLHWTSFDVVAKVRNALKKHYGVKVKIGHAGTLDPLASGVLILCAGKATKSIETWMEGEKGYKARITFGATTPSFDLETEVQPSGKQIPNFTPELWESIEASFTGEIHQVPPIYSAIRVDGKRAYAEARKGKDIDLPTRTVTIHSLKFHGSEEDTWILQVQCSKGTYIRSLANDLGVFLGCGAYLSGLERTQVGQFTTADCFTMEEILELLQSPKGPASAKD